MKNILIIEDHPLVAEATRSLFAAMVDRVVICKDAEQAAAAIAADNYWFRVLLDIGVPGATGLSLVRHVHSKGLAPRTAIITAYENLQWRAEVQSMGFLGYVVKTASVEAFSAAIEKILEGRMCFETLTTETHESHLTRRQIEILNLLWRGCSTKEVARRLALSPGTVDNHVSALIRALRANDRTHAVALGVQLGYIEQHGA
ncbi:response regulator transcription factor [Caldimonas brevitalea]|uniref:Two component transcriptional regulator, LuxR family n=1 Tax=Caldimonas brevitalea TaxID=413882 RepID=A0A0G3BUC1_9BURK|nr:response regulator transcription factor [Caldimonas brevitalea]AKJ30130.1 two component transcriptional regulator, LuxR family [Caldimonas brevitalea]